MLAPGVLVVSEPRRMTAAIAANRRVARWADGDLAVAHVGSDTTDLAARELLLVAAGEGDAAAVREILDRPPAHPAVTIVCDAAAAPAAAAPARTDRVVVVLGHREPGISPEHRISAHSRARMYRAAEAVLTDPVRAAVFTGYTETAGGLSEAEQMQREWTVPGVAVVSEVAGRDTAENASRSLPLILAMGGIRDVLVVTSLWHVRAPYFFAPYRRHGLHVHYAPARPLRHWGHLLVEELAKAPAAPLERAEALRELQRGGSGWRGS